MSMRTADGTREGKPRSLRFLTILKAVYGALTIGASLWGWYIGSLGRPFFYVWPVALTGCALLSFLFQPKHE